MRTMPSMVDMQRTPEDKAKDSPMGVLPYDPSNLPDYDYGLSGSFNKESLDKLDLEEDVHVGDYLCIHSLAKVTGVHMKAGSNEIDRVDFVMTHICADEEESEEENEYEAA